MRIRRLSGSDRKDVEEMVMEGYSEVAENPNFGDWFRLRKPTSREYGEIFKAHLSNIHAGHELFLCAEEDGMVLGYCCIKKRDIPDSEMSHVGTLSMRVRKGFRHMGIGRKLLGETLRKAKSKFEIAELYTLANNRNAKALFRSAGFKSWGVAPGYVKRNGRYIDLECMCRRL